MKADKEPGSLRDQKPSEEQVLRRRNKKLSPTLLRILARGPQEIGLSNLRRSVALTSSGQGRNSVKARQERRA